MAIKALYNVNLNNGDLCDWLIAQGDGDLERGIARAALAAGYRPPQAGTTWRVPEALAEAQKLGFDLRQCTINAALLSGRIKGAHRPARDWVLDPIQFLDWLNNKYTPRRRKAKA